MKKAWKKDEGVSPVIATILMVAITVVLAAVLYVMVVGLVDTDDNKPIAGAITSADMKANSTVEIVFGAFSGGIKPTSLTLMLENAAGERISLTWPGTPDSGSYALHSDTAGVTATYKDFQPAENSLNIGDSVVVRGLPHGEVYTIKVIRGNTAAQLTGAVQFTTPP